MVLRRLQPQALISLFVACIALGSGLVACAPANAVYDDFQVPLWRTSWKVEGNASSQLNLATRPVLEGLTRPVGIEHAGDGSNRLFVVEQGGRIVIVKNGKLLQRPFLDITPKVKCCGEQGLLGFAAHPDYADNGRFFVYYTDKNGDSIVESYEVPENANRADPRSGKVILKVAQPGDAHNAGQLKFGPDGYLYVSFGDGDYTLFPKPRAQDPRLLLGKIVRLDVDSGEPYRIPADNPFVGNVDNTEMRDEVWATGLRNPWRFSFDRVTNDLYIADVGQSQWEEINVQRATEDKGQNFGWPYMEGRECRPDCQEVQGTLPVLTYSHDDGCSVTGGYVYRGRALAQLYGTYLYADYCSGVIWGAAAYQDNWESIELFDTSHNISSFGEDESGEVFFADYGLGVLYQLTAGGEQASR